MNLAASILAGLLGAFFLVLGTAKVSAVPRMRVAAADVGYSITAYRAIGILEIAGAVGLVAGIAVAPLGTLSGAGLLILLGGALLTHFRQHDGPGAYAPAVVAGLLVAVYLGLHLGTA